MLKGCCLILFSVLSLTNKVHSELKLTKVGSVTDLKDAIDIIKTVLKNNKKTESNDDGLRTFNSGEWNYDFREVNNAQIQLNIKPIDEEDPNKNQFRYRPGFPTKPKTDNTTTTRKMTVQPYATVTQQLVQHFLSFLK
ncbi:uncharacterized protein LOC126911876 [Spodoptera frugiperda]|uniref:Uncharacterized protein LOC126911876 n=1 Tax=Spodoptera frugiperda TaxID=7108 RepID=A0A9R0F0A0_SPOFR|nr:uncharacterized protein LOC126911876 [Spodoptera frugiperda]